MFINGISSKFTLRLSNYMKCEAVNDILLLFGQNNTGIKKQLEKYFVFQILAGTNLTIKLTNPQSIDTDGSLGPYHKKILVSIRFAYLRPPARSTKIPGLLCQSFFFSGPILSGIILS